MSVQASLADSSFFLLSSVSFLSRCSRSSTQESSSSSSPVSRLLTSTSSRTQFSSMATATATSRSYGSGVRSGRSPRPSGLPSSSSSRAARGFRSGASLSSLARMASSRSRSTAPMVTLIASRLLVSWPPWSQRRPALMPVPAFPLTQTPATTSSVSLARSFLPPSTTERLTSSPSSIQTWAPTLRMRRFGKSSRLRCTKVPRASPVSVIVAWLHRIDGG